MVIHVPPDLPTALDILAAEHDITVLAGGTDLMVAINYGQRRPESMLSLRRVLSKRAST